MSARVRHRVRAALALTAAAVLAGVVHASAPPDQYRAFTLADGCVGDTKTYLAWMRVPITPSTAPLDAGALTFANAASYCANAGNGGMYSWRLPSVNELETLVDENPHQEDQGGTLVPVAIDANAFPGTPVDTAYWTSTVVPREARAWVVDFSDGSSSTALISAGTVGSVRCVTQWINGAPPQGSTCPFPAPSY